MLCTANYLPLALLIGGNLFVALVSRTTGLLSRAFVPLTTLLGDFGDKQYEGFELLFETLTAAFNYMIHIRQEIVRFLVQNSVLANLLSWDGEVSTAELFLLILRKM